MSIDIWRAVDSLRARLGRLESVDRLLSRVDTWTPTYVGGTAAGITTYTAQVGEYVRLGDTVFAWGIVSWSGATGTGDGRVSLPVIARSTSGAQYPVAIRTNGLAFTADFLVGLITQGTDYMIIQEITTGAGGAATVPVDAGGGVISFSAVYPVPTS